MAMKGGNPQNLKRPTTDEARINGRKGGIASGKSRRRRKTMKALAIDLLLRPLSADDAAGLAPFGVSPDDADYQTAVLAALIKKAAKGNVNAIQLLAALTGDDPYVKVKQAELNIKRAELRERQRQFDLTRDDRSAADAADDDFAAAWLDAVISTANEDAGMDADNAGNA